MRDYLQIGGIETNVDSQDMVGISLPTPTNQYIIELTIKQKTNL